MAAAIRGLIIKKAAVEDKIRPEMLKTVNRGVRWLTRVCQVTWKLRKASKDWQTGVVIPIKYTRKAKSVRIIEEYHFLDFQKSCSPNANQVP